MTAVNTSNKNIYLYKNYLSQFDKEINSKWYLLINSEENVKIEELINESKAYDKGFAESGGPVGFMSG